MGERRALGKGLGALLGDKPAPPSGPSATSAALPAPPESAGPRVRMLPIEAIAPNPDQPREHMDDAALQELAASIQTDGVIQPILVRAENEGFVLIAGERRWRAARMAGLSDIPALVHTLADPADSLRLALVENIQRRDLNPLEEARAYQELIQRCGLTQEQLAMQVSRNRSTVTNLLRLLQLPEEIQRMLAAGAISMGHARALVGVETRDTQRTLAKRIVAEGLSVRQVERLLSTAATPQHRPRHTATASPAPDPYYASIEDALRKTLGTKVTVKPTEKGGGRITIEYYTAGEFEGILARLGLRSGE